MSETLLSVQTYNHDEFTPGGEANRDSIASNRSDIYSEPTIDNINQCKSLNLFV